MEPKFNSDGLICAIAQDAFSGNVLMQAYMNNEAYEATKATGYAHYFSRSRNKLWKKGEESGHLQKVLGMSLDCDGDSVLLLVEQTAVACHTGEYSCFHNFDERSSVHAAILQTLENTIINRKQFPAEGSYTNYLFDKGREKICKKLGEEASECIIAAMKGDNAELANEAADLLYHLVVMLADRGMSLNDVYKTLMKRSNVKKD